MILRKLHDYRQMFLIVVALMLCGCAWMLLAYLRANAAARGKIYGHPPTCPVNAIGILFGCSKLTAGHPNEFYLYRIQAAVQLYQAGKIKHLLISGDNHSVTYNEPEMMKRDLIQAGVPADAITCDYAGFSTFETIVRAKEIFGVRAATLITQRYHLPRALFLAAVHGITAIGYEAREPVGLPVIKCKIREICGRIITYGDLQLHLRQPKFLGKQEFIMVNP